MSERCDINVASHYDAEGNMALYMCHGLERSDLLMLTLSPADARILANLILMAADTDHEVSMSLRGIEYE